MRSISGLFTIAFVLHATSLAVFSATYVAPVTTAELSPPPQHYYSTGGFNPPGSVISESVILDASSITPFAAANRFEATIAAPTGYKFAITPPPAPYETTMTFILSWGNSSAGAPAPTPEPAVFTDLIGTVPTPLLRGDHSENSVIRVGGQFQITAPVEFTSMTLSFLGGAGTTNTLGPQPTFSFRAYSTQVGLPDTTIVQILPIPEPGAGLLLSAAGVMMLRRGRLR